VGPGAIRRSLGAASGTVLSFELPRTPLRRSSLCPITPVLRAYPRSGPYTNRYYLGLMYAGLRATGTLHKKSCRIGPGLCRTSEKVGNAKFAEFLFHALW
jgi:hypothetical protein